MAQFDMTEFILVPLTPIHVGGGDEAKLSPEDYRLRDGKLERLSTRAILARLPEAEQTAWLKDMGRDMEGALHRLQDRATEAEISERIAIHPASSRELAPSGKGHGRRNQIDAFFRSGGRPVLPGSSMKGVLRTAWLAYCVSRFGPPRLPGMREWQRMRGGERAREAAKAVEHLFSLKPGKQAQDSDPFRDVTVDDAALGEGATRIDPVRTWKLAAPSRDRQRSYGFDSVGQMHRERLRSVADGGPPPLVPVQIGLRAAGIRREAARLDGGKGKRPQPDRLPQDAAALLAAIEAHHAPLWQREVDEKFFAGEAGARLRAALGLFAHLRRDGDAPEAALLRIGWASHAEAKSLGPDRRIERPQAKGDGRVASEGTTRHVVDLNGHPLPFGWALLVRAERWQAPPRWLDPPAARAAAPGAVRTSAPAPQPRAASALGQQLRFAKGQRVLVEGDEGILQEEVTMAARPNDTVWVDFGGERDAVKVNDIKALK